MSSRFSPVLKRRHICNVALAYAVACGVPMHAAAEASASLAGRSNEDLLAIIRGGATNRPPEPLIKSLALPPNFWSLPARDAALAFVLANCSDETKRRAAFSIPDPVKKQAPVTGEVGIRWEGTGSGPMAGGLTILRAAGEKSELAYSAVELAGEASKAEIRAAINRTKTIALPSDIARHAFQVIWWLGHVRQTGEAETRGMFMSHETQGTFWIKPGLSRTPRVSLLTWPLEPKTGEKFDLERHAGFAEFLISEAVKEQPQPLELVTAILGKGIYPDKGLKFLHVEPRPRNPEEAESWVTRTLEILRNPKYRSWRSRAISNLVPWQEPMRFRDSRIDAALLAIAEETVVTGAPRSKQARNSDFTGVEAAEHLAWRECTQIFPALLATLRRAKDDRFGDDYLLGAAALLGSRHRELRTPIVEYLHEQLVDVAHSKHGSWKLFDTAWRFDFRELQPLLESLATTNADEVEDELGTTQVSPPRPAAPRHFHAARKILLIWNEPDPLTKLKLDALWEASSTVGFLPAEHLQRQFEQLGDPARQAFREFVEWMKPQKLPYNWDPRRIEWVISPEALAVAE
jgi:hypothetical protein